MSLICKNPIVAASLILFSSLMCPADALHVGTSQAANQDKEAEEWQRYTVAGEEFSVLLPVLPAMSTTSVDVNRHQSRRERILGAYSEGVVYAIFTYERKGRELADLIPGFTNNQTAPLNKLVTGNGITGKSFRFEDDNRLQAIHFFATAKNLYVFKAQGSKLGNPAQGVLKFLSSIKFEKNSGGTKVVDGIGEEPRSSVAVPLDNSAILRSSEVSFRALVVTKPEPRYTEAARRNRVTGTVVLHCVFSSSGVLTNIATARPLPDGLTEQAIESARQIRFIPGIKDGQFVSIRMQLEYNFNLY